jgi:hypothetical protein
MEQRTVDKLGDILNKIILNNKKICINLLNNCLCRIIISSKLLHPTKHFRNWKRIHFQEKKEESKKHRTFVFFHEMFEL